MHYYRFIRPGAKMIKVFDSDADVEAIGFKNGNDYTVVVINLVKTKKTVQFSDFAGKPEFFHVYRSSALEMCAYVGKVTNNTFELPGESVATITYNAASPNTTYGPLAPANLTATNISDNSITVTWSASSPWDLNGSPVSIAGYIVYINGVKKTATPQTATSFTFTKLTPGTKYTIEVYTRDNMINQSVASTISVITTCDIGGCAPITPDAIENHSYDLQISPNPASNLITVNLPNDNSFTVSIVGITGNTALALQNIRGKHSIDVTGLSSGVYIIMATNGVSMYKTKLVIE